MSGGQIKARIGRVWYTQDGVRMATLVPRDGAPPVVAQLPSKDHTQGDHVLIENRGGVWRLVEIGAASPA